jgi:undecaprenyl-diphosphatase
MVLISLISAFVARFVITDFIRFIHHRVRPFLSLNDSNLLINQVNQSSFPSGHAAFTFGLATVVYFYNKKLGVAFLIAALLVSIARVFVGVHWPSDILAGAIVGVFSGWLVNRLLKKN